MLSSKERLKKSFFRAGRGQRANKRKRVVGDDFDAILGDGEVLGKVGVVISKKSVARAVDRNRIRRLVYESMRPNHSGIKGEIVIIVKNNISDLKKQEVQLRLQLLLAKLK